MKRLRLFTRVESVKNVFSRVDLKLIYKRRLRPDFFESIINDYKLQIEALCYADLITKSTKNRYIRLLNKILDKDISLKELIK
jgi:hypothetical protein